MSALRYTIAVAATSATAIAGSYYTQQSVQSAWYACVRPSFAPPNWVFPVVWTSLYVALAIAFARSLRHDSALLTVLHCANLALNVAWCRAFFGARKLGEALAILVGNLGVAVAIAALSVDSVVGWLLVPYIVWLAFATLLNVDAYRKQNHC